MEAAAPAGMLGGQGPQPLRGRLLHEGGVRGGSWGEELLPDLGVASPSKLLTKLRERSGNHFFPVGMSVGRGAPSLWRGWGQVKCLSPHALGVLSFCSYPHITAEETEGQRGPFTL